MLQLTDLHSVTVTVVLHNFVPKLFPLIAIILSEGAGAEQTVIIPYLDFRVRGCLDWLEPHMRGEVGGAGSSHCCVSVSPVTLRSQCWWENRVLVFAEC